jgi:hypothetical protein
MVELFLNADWMSILIASNSFFDRSRPPLLEMTASVSAVSKETVPSCGLGRTMTNISPRNTFELRTASLAAKSATEVLG